MIYTVGDKQLYARYIRQQGTVQKGVGGSVWRTLEDVEKYLLDTKQQGIFDIFGVDASWKYDTMKLDKATYPTLPGYNVLLRTANIIKLDKVGQDG